MTNSSWNNANPWGPQGPSVNIGPGSYFEEYLTNTEVEEPRGCINSSECGSGFACVNGICIQILDEYGGPCLSGGSDGGSGVCGGSSAGILVSCVTDTAGACGSTGIISGGIGCEEPNENPANGGSWNPSSGDSCDAFCDNWGDSFSSIQPGCEGKECGNCEECSIFGECRRDDDGDCSCGSPPPNQTIRCYKCGESGEWLADTCSPPSEPKEEPEKPDCDPQSYCVTNDVCVTNTETGTVTCAPVEQCSDLPSECEPCDCSCDDDCPACQFCNASGVCEPEPDCDFEKIGTLNYSYRYCWESYEEYYCDGTGRHYVTTHAAGCSDTPVSYTVNNIKNVSISGTSVDQVISGTLVPGGTVCSDAASLPTVLVSWTNQDGSAQEIVTGKRF